MEGIKEQMEKLGHDRDGLRKKARRTLPEAETNVTKERITEKTAEIRELRRELKVCSQIQERSAQVEENLAIVDADRKRERER